MPASGWERPLNASCVNGSSLCITANELLFLSREDEEGEMDLISYRTELSASRPILAVSIGRSLMP